MFFSSRSLCKASGVVRRLHKPRFSTASLIQASSYPFPLKIILLWSTIVFRMRSCRQELKSFAFSSTSANCIRASATAALSIIFGQAIESLEPTMRNSNLLPVKANGEVLLRSVESRGNLGRISTPSLSCFFSAPK